MAQPQFCNHTVIDQNPADYVEIMVSPQKIFEQWKLSFFAHELLHKDGSVKSQDELSGDTLNKFIRASESFHRGEEVPKPVLGVGIFDGVEIGIGREIIAAAYHSGLNTIPVHVRQAQLKEIEKLLK